MSAMKRATRLLQWASIFLPIAACNSSVVAKSEPSGEVETAKQSRICLRVSDKSQILSANSMAKRMHVRGAPPFYSSINCEGSFVTLYIVLSRLEGIVHRRIDHSTIPRSIDCCSELTPLELNEPITTAPLRYFALDDDAMQAKQNSKLLGYTFLEFEYPKASESSPQHKLYQPGWVSLDNGVPQSGVCVVIDGLQDQQAHPRYAYRVDTQLAACILKLFGQTSLATPDTAGQLDRAIRSTTNLTQK